MAITLERFVQNLIASGLFSADELAAFQERLPAENRPNDPQGLARELIRADKLTKYQAGLVYQGKTKGLVLGEYVISDQIGRGGMGQVFKARHRTTERVVAFKVLPGEAMRSPRPVERFHREVKAAEVKPGWERIQATKHCLVLAEKLAAAGNKDLAVKSYKHLRDVRNDPSEKHMHDAAEMAFAAA
jgi:serine/threonine protein kinase